MSSFMDSPHILIFSTDNQNCRILALFPKGKRILKVQTSPPSAEHMSTQLPWFCHNFQLKGEKDELGGNILTTFKPPFFWLAIGTWNLSINTFIYRSLVFRRVIWQKVLKIFWSGSYIHLARTNYQAHNLPHIIYLINNTTGAQI